MLLQVVCRHDNAKATCTSVKKPRKQTQDVLPLLKKTSDSTAKGLGPRAALDSLDMSSMSNKDRIGWLEQARVKAITGSCSLSMASVRSGVRCYMAFAGLLCILMV